MTCPKCHGGRVFKRGRQIARCHFCGGSGRVKFLCRDCDGQGVRLENSTVEFEIPKGGTVDGTITVPDVGDKIVSVG